MLVLVLLLVLLLLLFVALLWFVHWRWETSHFVRELDLIPGPKRRFFIGSIDQIPANGAGMLQVLQRRWIAEYGHIYRVWMGRLCFVDISSPPLVEKILTSQKLIDKGGSYDVLLPWLGEGLLLASGDQWRKSRRLLTPAFHFQILDDFFDVFNNNADILCGQLVSETTGALQKEIDISPYLKRCTLDIVCEAAMGIQVNAQIQDSPYIMAVQRISELIVQRFFNFWQFIPDWLYHTLSTNGKEHYKQLKIIQDFTAKVIRDRKRDINLDYSSDEPTDSFGIKKRRAFLDLMLIAVKNGVNLSDLDIRNQVDTFMFEGHDTTASALVWFLYCMATNTDHQEKVWYELMQVFGDSDRPCTLEDTTHLKYLDACIKESLRLYPSVPAIERYISEDIELGGYKIPSGASLSIHIYALHRNESFFPDPLAFKPERFMYEEGGGRHPFAFIPFSAGPRNCIGQRFALLEEKVVISSLLRRFRFYYDTAKHGQAKPCADLVLKPQDGMPLIITHR